MAKLSANSGDPDQTPPGVWSGSALFAIYPFRVLQTTMGLKYRVLSSRKHAYLILTPLNPTFI